MKGLLGIKVGMTQVFDENGVVSPVTIVRAGPCYVTQIKTESIDGYDAVQIGFAEVKESRLSRGELGHLGLVKSKSGGPRRKKPKNVPPVRHLAEFRTEDGKAVEGVALGEALTVDLFEVGAKVDVSGTTKGRGFAGVVKRHGFGGGPKTHGQSDRWRAPGSIGATSTMARVLPGTRMAGHFGNSRHTVQNLQVVRIDAEQNLIAIKGAIPGVKGGLVIIRPAVKG